ncbi:hypothetical protein [Formosimonas limnophila]|uniref:hypothetical protein n=1 Tax=Formosimonas limnophila TaxID=1384487 RepID=UPI00167C31EA|nr:hypothetical protein [Formosimonas limnophila]
MSTAAPHLRIRSHSPTRQALQRMTATPTLSLPYGQADTIPAAAHHGARYQKRHRRHCVGGQAD